MSTQEDWKLFCEEHQDHPEFRLEKGTIFDRLDQDVVELLNGPKADGLVFSPLEVEFLIEEAVDLLERCLELKQEAQELEVKIVRRHLDWQSQQREIEVSRAQLLDGFLDAQFRSDVPSDKADAMRTRELKRLEIQDRTISLLRSKASTKGDGLNFKERYAIHKDLFEQDLVKAYRRLIFLQTGLREVYGEDPGDGSEGPPHRLPP